MENDRPVVGVDLGGTKILSAVVRADGAILARAKLPTEASGGLEHVIDRIAQSVFDAVREARLSPADVPAMAVGSPGPLDPHKGIILEAPNLGWKNVPLGAELEKRTGIKTFVENDVDMGTLGEFVFGAAKGADSVLGVFVGTGIGGGIIIHGKLLRGAAGVAGEIGHIVVKRNGAACNCGGRGCMEAYAGRWAVARYIHKAVRKGRRSSVARVVKGDHVNLTSGTLRSAWRADDKLVRKALTRACKYLGAGIGSVVNLLSPEVVVIGGGVFEALGKELLPITVKHIRRNAMEASLRNVRIVLAALGDDANVLGASVAARQRLCE
ncbi:MAG: ROK family protein [Planctomycetota bacterium]